MSNSLSLESVDKKSEFLVHRYELVLVSMKPVLATSPKEAISQTDIDLTSYINRSFDGCPVSKISITGSNPFSYIIEPLVDGLPDFSQQKHFADDASGIAYELSETLRTKSEDSSRLVDRISNVSLDALTPENTSSVLLAIIREARLIQIRHSAQENPSA